MIRDLSVEALECKTPSQCKGIVGSIMDVLLGIKMVVLLCGNFQAYKWWKHHKGTSFTFMIRFLLVASSAIIISEFAYRFTDKELVPLFV